MSFNKPAFLKPGRELLNLFKYPCLKEETIKNLIFNIFQTTLMIYFQRNGLNSKIQKVQASSLIQIVI